MNAQTGLSETVKHRVPWTVGGQWDNIPLKYNAMPFEHI